MKILLVEDEKRMAELIYRGLVEEGHQVDHVTTTKGAQQRLDALDYHVVVLDWTLPDGDGLEWLQTMRSKGWRLPVLMLTARGSPAERVLGLRTGADDYLPKPFDFGELVARLEALHRRSSDVQLGDCELGDVVFRRAQRQLCRKDASIELTPREYKLLCALAEHPGNAVTRTELLSNVWGQNFDGDPNVVDVYVGYVRSKLAKLKAERVTVSTVRGLGFRLEIKTPS